MLMENLWNKGRLETSIWAAKLVLLCVGMVSSVVLFRVAIIPYSFNLVVSTLPSLWLLLSPPYVYLFLNLIIITIVASSSYQKHPDPDTVRVPDDHLLQPQNDHFQDDPDPSSGVHAQDWSDIITTAQQEQSFTSETKTETENEFVLDSGSFGTTENGVTMNLTKSVSSKDGLAEAEGSGSRVQGSENETSKDSLAEAEADERFEQVEEESLDSMWKAISEANGKALKPQLKKSGTWNVRTSPAAGGGGEWAKKELRKWDTFNNPVIRERSMNQDELNQRVEAFIKKFNNDMRLERQDSDQRYVEMVNRSVC